MGKEIAAWKRMQERNKLIYNFKYYSHRSKVPDLVNEEEKKM
jgi:hypothetical protein